ncbi:MAG TPA: 2-hydroxyhepta-2,4-diene-1,7-dioate isomerase [Bacteroidetes bacterium]|jgi:2-keto-4-pentenoate hydratase/2-oxohepta-3-ene-1,7-dioic acid hydratase in catechol pathway|nr:2-hydroxyhepta-2,4-diene-1,7-dioate isomerase [Bacteroidota bacterium]|tara:strand:- start:1705 stop:2313 length:609 start_codon:yes stop_codon:yes gene_type:complete
MKIICIGRNYAAHAAELGNELAAEPVIFMKPDSAVFRQRDAFYIPDWTSDVHYELEVVVRINRLGKNIEAKFAPKYFAEFTVGIDFTARDVQSALKAKGLPWEKAKAFDQSAVLGDFLSVDDFDLNNLHFQLKKNGQVVQDGDTSLMLHNISQLIEHSSQYFTLKIGDLLFTGTPEGVGPVAPGDLLEGFIEGKKVLNVKVR